MIVTTPEQRRRKLKTQKQHFKDWTLRSKKATCYGLQLYMLDPWSGFGEQVWIVGISYASRLTLSFPCKVVQVWLSVLFCCNSLMFLSCCRLQYFARGVQVYIKQLRAALQGKSGDALRTDEVCTTDIVCLLACMRVYVPLIHWASALCISHYIHINRRDKHFVCFWRNKHSVCFMFSCILFVIVNECAFIGPDKITIIY